MVTDRAEGPRVSRQGIFLLIALVAISLFIVWGAAGRAMKMRMEANSSAQVEALKPGNETKLVLEIATSNEHEFSGKLLEKQTETVYKRTATLISARYDPETKIVMGKPADVHPNAVVHVSGTVVNGGNLNAKQIVILTGYVEVR